MVSKEHSGEKFETAQWGKVNKNLQQVDGVRTIVEESTQAPRPRSANGNFIFGIGSTHGRTLNQISQWKWHFTQTKVCP